MAKKRRRQSLTSHDFVIPEDRQEIAKLTKKEIALEQEWQETQKRMFVIQKSTRTSIPQFIRLHNALRARFRWYYKWHLFPYARAVHLLALILYVTTLSLWLWLNYHPKYVPIVYAAAVTWDGGGDDLTCGGNPGDGNKWSCTLNWSGDTPPGASDVATFDATNTKNVTIDGAINIQGIDINAGYTGIVTQSAYVALGTAGYDQADGTFTGGSADIDIDGSFSLTAGVFTSTSGILYINDSYTHSGGTFTANSGTITFDATDAGNTLSGTMTGASGFNKIAFNGIGGEWTIQDPMLVSAANATDTFVIGNGTVTMGNGNGDNLDVRGKITIAATSGQTGILQTAEVSQGSTITFDMNANAATPTCANCIISVGATSGVGQGNLKIRKNTILRLNPRSAATASDTGIEVESTGYLEIQGSQDATGTSDGTTNETTITDTGKIWGVNDHQNKVVRITNSSSLAFGQIYTITANDATSLTRADNSSNNSAIASTSGTGPVRTVCASSNNVITADNEGIGRYLHDSTDSTGYLKIVDSINNSCAGTGNDRLDVIAEPDLFTIMSNGDTIDISDAVRQNDQYEILDYAHVTAENGTVCDVMINQAGEAYIYAKAGSKSVIKHADICNLGRNASNKLGAYFSSVDGANANEGVTIDKSRIRNGYYGAYLYSSNNNSTTYSKGVTNSSFFSNGYHGLVIHHSLSNTISSNLGYQNTEYAFYGDNASDNTFSYNIAYQNNTGLNCNYNCHNNIYLANQIYRNTFAIYLYSNATNNVLSSNILFGNSATGGITLDANANNNIIFNNQSYKNDDFGIDVDTNSNKNIVFSNQVYGNGTAGFGISTNSPNNTFFSNQIYSNTVGLGIYDDVSDTGIVSVNDNFGGLGVNTTADIRFYNNGVHNLKLYNDNLASATEVSGISVAGAYIISRKHDGSNGTARIWGDYSVPDQNNETPQDETTDKFNYAENSWPDSFTPHGYNVGYGAGTEDSNLDYNINGSFGGAGSVYNYHLLCNSANCVTNPNSWDVYRNGTLLAIKASTGATFTDTELDGGSAPNIQFKIDDAGTDYTSGATYTFTAWKASGDTNTQKTVQVQQNGDSITIGSGKTMQFDGAAGNLSTFNIATATNSYDLAINGTLSGGNNDLFVSGSTTGGGTVNLSSGSNFSQRVAGDSKTFGSTANANNWTFQNLAFRNATAADRTITTNTGGTGQIIVNNTLYVGDGTETNNTALDNETNDRVIDANNDVSVTTRGTLSASSTAAFNVARNWANLGTFTPNSGTVTLDGGNQAVDGSSTFNKLSKIVAAAQTLTFGTGSTQTILDTLTLKGATGNLLSLRSSVPGTQWRIDPQGTRDLEYLDVQDSNNINPTLINVIGKNCVNSNNNVGWLFSGGGGPTPTPTASPTATASPGISPTPTPEAGTSPSEETPAGGSALLGVKISGPIRAVVSTNVQFSTTVTSGSPTSYNWDFGDGSSSKASTPTKNYSQTGIYQVKLTVADRDNRSSQASHYLSVVPPAPDIKDIKRQENKVLFKGSAIASGDITLYIYSGLITTNGRSNDRGNWEISHSLGPTALAEGQHTARATVTDARKMTSDPSEDTVFIITPTKVEIVESFIDKAARAVENIFGRISATVSSPKFIQRSQDTARIMTPVAVVSSIGLGVIATSSTLIVSNLVPYLLYILDIILEALGIRKKRKPWGVVYDSEAKAPVALAIVRIYRIKDKKLLETRVTDKNGRFGFLVPEGQYYLKVTKAGYLFASRKIKPGTAQDDIYTNLYHGAVLEITPKRNIISTNIPIDPAKTTVVPKGLKHKLMIAMYFIRSYVIYLHLFSVGMVIFSFILFKHGYDLAIIVLLLFFVLKDLHDRRLRFSWGVVYDSKTKLPLERAIVRIYDSQYNKLRETKITDENGRYGFLVPKGQYYLKVEKPQFSFPSKWIRTKNDGPYHRLYFGESIVKETDDELISVNVPVDKR